MITGGEGGGFVHRIMPPTSWNCGPIPVECYNPDLGRKEIRDLLFLVYLEESRIRALANSDDPKEIVSATIALEILVEIDADTIWGYNMA